jgi:signal transduction histidine kinase
MALHTIRHHWETFALRELFEEVCQPMESRFQDQAIRRSVDIPAELAVTADRDLMLRAVRNLVLNAVESMPNGGMMEVTAAVSPAMIELEVADSGRAMTEEEQHQAFELLPSAQRGAAGWGLATVAHIAQLHGGNVTTANCPDGGVAFTLRIPRKVALEAAA